MLLRAYLKRVALEMPFKCWGKMCLSTKRRGVWCFSVAQRTHWRDKARHKHMTGRCGRSHARKPLPYWQIPTSWRTRGDKAPSLAFLGNCKELFRLSYKSLWRSERRKWKPNRASLTKHSQGASSELRALHVFTYLILSAALWVSTFYSHFTDEETKVCNAKFFAKGNAEEGIKPEPEITGESQISKELVYHANIKLKKEGRKGGRENIN